MEQGYPLIIKFEGGKVDDGAETVSIMLLDSQRHGRILRFTPEAAKAAAFDLLALVGQLEDIQEEGVQQDRASGETIRSTAMPIGALRVGWAGDRKKAHIHFWTKKRAHFPLSLEAELIDQLRLQLSQNPGDDGSS